MPKRPANPATKPIEVPRDFPHQARRRAASSADMLGNPDNDEPRAIDHKEHTPDIDLKHVRG